jgi:hypothetical protein
MMISTSLALMPGISTVTRYASRRSDMSTAGRQAVPSRFSPPHQPRPPTTRGTPPRAVREFPASPRLVIAVMVFPLVSGRASGSATRKNTAQMNTIHFRDTMFTL